MLLPRLLMIFSTCSWDSIIMGLLTEDVDFELGDKVPDSLEVCDDARDGVERLHLTGGPGRHGLLVQQVAVLRLSQDIGHI